MSDSSNITPAGRFARQAFLDRVEQIAIIGLWALLVLRIGASSNPYGILVLLSELAVLIFVLIRRPTQNISMRLEDWLLAMTATAVPLLLIPGTTPFAGLTAVGIALAVVGNIWQLWAKLTLRRSFGIAPANRGVKVKGPYQFMRHPMYAGYLLVHIGLFILMGASINLLIYAVAWAAQVRRLLAEEAWLGQDPAYQAYQEKVRWRLIPGIF